jgi:hypothetical protein
MVADPLKDSGPGKIGAAISPGISIDETNVVRAFAGQTLDGASARNCDRL